MALHFGDVRWGAQAAGEAESEPVKQCRLRAIGANDTADPKLALGCRRGRQNHIGALDNAKLVQDCAGAVAQSGAAFRGDLHEFTELFHVRWSPATALQRLRRVVNCWYERPDNPDDETCPRTMLVQRFRTWADQQFSVTLTEEFMREVEQGAPISLPIVRHLAERLGPLDLYLWQAFKIHRGQAATVSIFGPEGPLAVLSSATDRSRARQDICNRQALIRQIWKKCPYRISTDGVTLIYEPAATR